LRIAAFATMFHQDWSSRHHRPALPTLRQSLLPADPIPEIVTAMPGESTS
jgi:hypothetical protein